MQEDEKQMPENEPEAQPAPQEPQEPVAEAPQDNIVAAEFNNESAPEAGPGPRARRQGRGRGRDRRDAKVDKQPEVPPEFVEKVLSIRRVTKVTKGGKKLSFSALVVVGDGKSNVGYGQEKAAEVATAIRKAMASAKKKMVKVPLKGSTIPHEIIGVCGSAHVLLKPAGEGTGVIAAGPVRAICEGAGIHNILTKCHKSNNPVNVVKAAMNGLTRLKVVQNNTIGKEDHAGS